MRAWFAIGSIVAVLVGACATQGVYESRTLTPEGSASLSVTSGGDVLVDLLAVDGLSCRALGNSVELVPGVHRIDFRISKTQTPRPIPLREVHEHTLSFEAEPGHAYTLQSEFDQTAVHVWIADGMTGDRVAEVHLKRV